MSKYKPEVNFPFQFPDQAVSFDAEAFDDLIRSQGVEMVHFRAMRCPIGMIDPDDIRRPHEHHANCSNGFLYRESGVITVGWQGNSNDNRFIDAGRLDGSTVQVVVPRFYDCPVNKRAEWAQFDRVYLKEDSITVSNWETFAAHVTGYDRLQFPVVCVSDLIDSNGNDYIQGTDFVVENGQIKWTGQRRPGIEPKTGKGVVCTARYSYRPFWYVKTLMHEVRVAQIEDPTSGDRSVERMPQSLQLQREYFFEKEQRDKKAPPATGSPSHGVTGGPDSARQQHAPADGIFGPR
jgi:hypothetical protein